MKTLKRIGILTSGGDAPGMNPCIRAIVRAATAEGISCIGIRRGYAGLINSDIFELSNSAVDGLTKQGGTILYTARCDEFRQEEYQKKGAATCKHLGLDGVIALGGDGTFRGAEALSRQGVMVVGVPATIDNDMGCTEYTLGFDTACNVEANTALSVRKQRSKNHKSLPMKEERKSSILLKTN